MNASQTPESSFIVIDGQRTYVGPERRIDRRRQNSLPRIERLLRNFGLDRRARIERRSRSSSWLLVSKAANL